MARLSRQVTNPRLGQPSGLVPSIFLGASSLMLEYSEILSTALKPFSTRLASRTYVSQSIALTAKGSLTWGRLCLQPVSDGKFWDRRLFSMWPSPRELSRPSLADPVTVREVVITLTWKRGDELGQIYSSMSGWPTVQRPTVMDVRKVICKAYDSTKPKTEELPLCSTVSNAAARADRAPSVSSLTLNHLCILHSWSEHVFRHRGPKWCPFSPFSDD